VLVWALAAIVSSTHVVMSVAATAKRREERIVFTAVVALKDYRFVELLSARLKRTTGQQGNPPPPENLLRTSGMERVMKKNNAGFGSRMHGFGGWLSERNARSQHRTHPRLM
jgi:hypothetical protein